jgi:LytS/YehU family sensor histidine kinase
MTGMMLVAGLLVCWLGGGFALITYIRQRRTALAESVARELAGAREARNRAELKLAVLAAQVEPHFLFNTLAGVRSAINVDPLRATAMIDHMVDYLRATIPQLRGHGDAVKADLASQMEASRAYLGLMHARLPRMAFAVSASPGLDNACLPPLLLISLVENAVKHGIEPKIGAGLVEVTAIANAEGQLVVTVSDDGVGFGGATSGTGIGLANVSARLEAIYGPRARLTLSANPGGGVVAAIAVPLEEYVNEEGSP